MHTDSVVRPLADGSLLDRGARIGLYLALTYYYVRYNPDTREPIVYLLARGS
jgi:hypothetical protein